MTVTDASPGCVLPQNGDTALHIAAAMGRRKLTRILLDGGVDFNLRNKVGGDPIADSPR